MEIDWSIFHFEDFEDCDDEPGSITGHPALVTCKTCKSRLEEEDETRDRITVPRSVD